MAEMMNTPSADSNGSGIGNIPKDTSKILSEDDRISKNMEVVLLNVWVNKIRIILDDHMIIILNTENKDFKQWRSQGPEDISTLSKFATHVRQAQKDFKQDTRPELRRFFKTIRTRYTPNML